jgi:hypothetical protein
VAGSEGTSGSGFSNPSQDAAVGGTAGTSAGTAGGMDGCASVRVEANVDIKPGNVIVLFDQSLTMNDAWMEPSGASSPKYAAAGKALLDAITPIVDQVNLGAIFFPTTAATNLLDLCTAQVAAFDMTPQITVRAGADFITAWNTHFMPPWSTILGTPLNQALVQADMATAAPGLVGNIAVVIFTDGQWTCEDGSEPTNVEKLFMRGVKTYVVGLPGALGAAGLDNLAQKGGTAKPGCTSNCFLLPTDTTELQAQLEQIVIETAGFESCTFTIQGKIVDKDLACTTGSVKLDDVPITCDPVDGYTIDDETHITFQGKACDALKASAGRLDATFPCNVVIPE